MPNYLDMLFSDPTLAKKLAAGPMDPNAFNSQLDTMGKLNSPSFAQSLGTGVVTPGTPAEAALGGVATAPVDTTPAAGAAAVGPVNPAMLASLMASTKPSPLPNAPAAPAPAAGRGFAPLPPASGGGQRFAAPGFFKALYGGK